MSPGFTAGAFLLRLRGPSPSLTRLAKRPGMGHCSSTEQMMVERAAEACRLDEGRAWAEINSGSTKLEGLAAIGALLADRLAVLPGELALRDPDPVTAIDQSGREIALSHGRHLHLVVRPEAPKQLLLTGHMDTVYGAEHS